jgi:hypothetical protein
MNELLDDQRRADIPIALSLDVTEAIGSIRRATHPPVVIE